MAAPKTTIEDRIHCHMEGLMLQSTPHLEAQTSLRREDAPHFMQALASIWKEFEAPLTEHNVKGCLQEGECHYTPFLVGN